MKINRSVLIALAAVLLLALWFWINSGKDEPQNESPQPISVQTNTVPTVVTQTITAENHAARLELFGRSEATREVTIKAETPGLVASTPIREGSHVKRGTIVCRQDMNARQANVDQAQALLKTRKLEYEAASKLVERGFASETQALTAQAALDAARAGVKQAEIELDNINLRAPFSGIYDSNIAEVGDYLAPGQPCGLLIELDPLTIAVELTETQLAQIKTGQTADIKLATGETVTGTVQYIESRANIATRTFRTEIRVPNKNGALKAGVTANVYIQSGETLAHIIPSSILGLNDDGLVGVKYVDSENIVRFAATDTVDETVDGIWVTGIPDQQVRIIIQGQDYVAPGLKVNTTDGSAK